MRFINRRVRIDRYVNWQRARPRTPQLPIREEEAYQLQYIRGAMYRYRQTETQACFDQIC